MAREPKDIWKVVGYAKLFESKNKSVYHTSIATHEQYKVVYKDQVFQKRIEPSPTQVEIKMTPKQLLEREDKGLCYHCDEKYTVSHFCKKLFETKLLLIEDTPKANMCEPIIEVVETNFLALEISFHAIARSAISNTMRL